MQRFKWAVIYIGVFCIFAGRLYAQQSISEKRTPVVFSCSCDDGVGSLYASAFRDALATSPRYQEGYASSVKGPDGKIAYRNWKVVVVSIDPNSSETSSGASSALSVVYLLGDDIYMNSSVQICGRDRVKSCATRTLATLDDLIHSLDK